MNHIIEVISQLITMISTYISVLLVLLFDGVVFGCFLMLINNNIIARLYSLPNMTYIDSVCIIFLIKLISLITKSININNIK